MQAEHSVAARHLHTKHTIGGRVAVDACVAVEVVFVVGKVDFSVVGKVEFVELKVEFVDSELTLLLWVVGVLEEARLGVDSERATICAKEVDRRSAALGTAAGVDEGVSEEVLAETGGVCAVDVETGVCCTYTYI